LPKIALLLDTGRTNPTVRAKHVANCRVCLTRVSSYVAKDTVFLGAFGKLRKASTNFVMSVILSARMEKIGSTGRIFMKFAF